MPFLRRRGVMASDSDMRRHTILVEPAPVTPKPLLRKPQPGALLSPDATASTGEWAGDDVSHENGEGGKSSVDTVATSAAASTFPGRESEGPYDRPESPPIQEESPKHRRFSMLRFRNASDSQLSARLKQQQQSEKLPPMPQPPAIITTAPTIDMDIQPKKQPRMKIPLRMRRSSDLPRGDQEPTPKIMHSSVARKEKRKTMNERTMSSTSKQTVTFEEPPRSEPSASPSSNADDQNAALVPPVDRLSESSRSEGSLSNPAVSTPQVESSSTSFFRLRRKHKQPESLFPLAHLPQRSKTPALSGTASSVSRTSTSSRPSNVAVDSSRPSTGHDGSTPVASPTHAAGYMGRPFGSPATALFRPASRNSGQSSPTRVHLSLRGRSSTMSSLGESFVDDRQHPGTTRTSSSTGRKSFGDLLGLSRIRQNPDNLRHGSLTPATPGSNTSKNNSLQINREPIILPERREDDTPAKYLARLEEVLSRGVIASALSKENDPFSAAVLRSYMRTFSFFEEPMDMAIRKLLMEAELPKETQQIDRCLQAFANRYHECNPGIYSTPDQAYFIAFSLLILHTDVFNKNNKYKMQKADYLKNTHGEGIFDDVLECFYDNISYTPFIHVEDDLTLNGDRTGSLRSKKKSIFPNGTSETLRRSKDPIDPYTLILDGRLDTLRPPLKDQIALEEHYSYLGTAKNLNLKELQNTFFKTGVLQIVSARSRPDAFMTEKTANNPQEAHPGIVDIKVTKVGLLWRKDTKKKKTRSPWQEWGAILTGAQLYFFRNTTWVKNLMHQYETHVKSGHDGIPLIFNPPLEQFKPDALMSTHGAVALWDASYKKHKNAFVYVRHGGLEEVLLAQNEEDRNDWLAKLNYAAAFRTSGVRMRGVVGGNYEGQSRRAIRRLDSTDATQLIQTPSGEVSINRSRIDHQMARDILVARREVIRTKIDEADEKLQSAHKLLETQLRNARHLLILAPIQDKTRDQVRGGAAKIIAQLKWSRTEIWRLKCHRDILALDLEEEKEANGELDEDGVEISLSTEKLPLVHEDSRSSSQKAQQQSPRAPAPLTLAQSPESVEQTDGDDSPRVEDFQTPPTSATDPSFYSGQSSRDLPPVSHDHLGLRKTSVSSAASSLKPVATSTPPRAASSPANGPDRALNEQTEEDDGERQVLEQSGLLEMEAARTSSHSRNSSGKVHEDGPDRPRRVSIPGPDKEGLERNKMRRSLQRTLRDGAGHLSHHRSRKGKDSASSGGMSDETVRESEVLTRGAGSFTVHGKKASVVNFGSELQSMSNDERMRQRKQSYQGDDHGLGSPASIDDDYHSVLAEPLGRTGRRGSGTSASTATARSFRELHRKYSSSRTHRLAATGGLTVPSDEDSDAAVSFSDGRRSPLPPLDDEDEDPGTNPQMQARFYTPEPPSSPIQQKASEAGEESDEEATQEIERLGVQAVSA